MPNTSLWSTLNLNFSSCPTVIIFWVFFLAMRYVTEEHNTLLWVFLSESQTFFPFGGFFFFWWNTKQKSVFNQSNCFIPRLLFEGTSLERILQSTACWRSLTTSQWHDPTPCGRKALPPTTKEMQTTCPGTRRKMATSHIPSTPVSQTPQQTMSWRNTETRLCTGRSWTGTTRAATPPSRTGTWWRWRPGTSITRKWHPCSQTCPGSSQITTPTWRASPSRWNTAASNWSTSGSPADPPWTTEIPSLTPHRERRCRASAPRRGWSTVTATGDTAWPRMTMTNGQSHPTWTLRAPSRPWGRDPGQARACRSRPCPTEPAPSKHTSKDIPTAPTPTPACPKLQQASPR